MNPASHLIVLPILLPLLTALAMLLMGDQRRRLKGGLSLLSMLLNAGIASALLVAAARSDMPNAASVYLPGNWPVPFGITLVVDRLSALMLVLAAVLALASLMYALARWHRAGVYFHTLIHLQLMGLNGAFLTADLFNLFVFFEVLLASSYALLLHGGGGDRVRAGLHYIAINLLASLLFLIGVAILYGVTGTLNMADIAGKLRLAPVADLGLLHAGAAILGLAFLAKAAIWPLGFWLAPAYTAASAPAAALFSILTKVGIYALLRLWTLSFPASAGESAFFGGSVMVWGGLATLAFGSIGMLASQHLARIASFSVVATSGTLVASIGFADPALQAGALYYLASSTLGACALFLLVEMLDRAREIEPRDAQPTVDDGTSDLPMFIDEEPPEGVNLDEGEEALVGRAIPISLALLGLAFLLTVLVIAGLPPMTGFIGKLGILMALAGGPSPSVPGWVLFGLLITSGLMAVMALMRVGMRYFWTLRLADAPRLRVEESLAVGLVLAGCLAMVAYAEPAQRYMQATAQALFNPERYIGAVLQARPIGAPPSPAAEAPR